MYPPDQPEADTLDDDGAAYGAEEAEMQAALEKELEETEAKMAKNATNGNADKEMTDSNKVKEEDEVSEAGSEDLEEESSDEDDEDEEGEDEEGAEGEDTEMADGDDKPTASTGTATAQANDEQKGAQPKPQVMVH